MPSAQKRKILEKAQKRERRGRTYLIAIVLIVAASGVGYFAYSLATAARPDFMIAAPPGVAVLAGTPSTSKINVTALNQFNGVVDLTATGSAGLSVSIKPATITGSGVAYLTASSTSNGTYTVTVTGTSGSLTHTVNMVTAPLLATLSTTDGTIVVQLFPASAPKTVANIVSLAKSGFYSDLVWHRIVRTSPGVIQTGDPNTRGGTTDRSTWGTGGSSQTVPYENNTLHNARGFLGMARSQDLNSGSSQFYINMADNSFLDPLHYTVFGQVLSGMSAADALWNTPTNSQDQPINPVFLLSITISGG